MRLVDAHKIRCERDDFDTFQDYMAALRSIKNAKTVVTHCRDCLFHKGQSCTVWRDKTVVVACNTPDEGYCYLGKERTDETD